jgi:hypothetical protein
LPARRAYTLAHTFQQLYQDITDGTALTPDFEHALRLHRLLDHIQRSATQHGLARD